MNEIGIKTIGIIGAGVMGSGVAQRFAKYGYDVILIDISQDILEKSINSVNRNLMIDNMMNKEKTDVKKVLSRITTNVDYQALKDADVVIENIPEVIDIKKEVYIKLDEFCKESCCFLVNTSCISITEIASNTHRADKIIGVHFMNPVPMQKFSEVIKGFYTSEETIQRIQQFLISAEIDCTVINDSPGFVSNRLSHIFMNEAANLVLEGVAEPEQVDKIFTEGFHHKMGPLHTADLIGLDTVVNSLKILYDSYQDPKYRCSPLLKKMVDAGLLGRKTGKGFFKY